MKAFKYILENFFEFFFCIPPALINQIELDTSIHRSNHLEIFFLFKNSSIGNLILLIRSFCIHSFKRSHLNLIFPQSIIIFITMCCAVQRTRDEKQKSEKRVKMKSFMHDLLVVNALVAAAFLFFFLKAYICVKSVYQREGVVFKKQFFIVDRYLGVEKKKKYNENDLARKIIVSLICHCTGFTLLPLPFFCRICGGVEQLYLESALANLNFFPVLLLLLWFANVSPLASTHIVFWIFSCALSCHTLCITGSSPLFAQKKDSFFIQLDTRRRHFGER